jgi:superfamily II DNA/RNA helicase
MTSQHAALPCCNAVRRLPQVLILPPTRELAVQIFDEAGVCQPPPPPTACCMLLAVKFGRAMGIKAACVYGGAPKTQQVGAARARLRPWHVRAMPCRCRRGRGEPSRGAGLAGVSPVLVQMW